MPQPTPQVPQPTPQQPLRLVFCHQKVPVREGLRRFEQCLLDLKADKANIAAHLVLRRAQILTLEAQNRDNEAAEYQRIGAVQRVAMKTDGIV